MCKANSGITPQIYFGPAIGQDIAREFEEIFQMINRDSPETTKASMNNLLLVQNDQLKGYEEKFNFTINDTEGSDQENQSDYFSQNFQMFEDNAWKPQNRIPVMFLARNVNQDVKSELLTNKINEARSMLS